MTKKTPYVGSYHDEEEKELIEAIENDTNPVPDNELTEERKQELQAIARNSSKGDREKISLRVPRADLARLKVKAEQEGLPYQTLINSILHKAANEK